MGLQLSSSFSRVDSDEGTLAGLPNHQLSSTLMVFVISSIAIVLLSLARIAANDTITQSTAASDSDTQSDTKNRRIAGN